MNPQPKTKVVLLSTAKLTALKHLLYYGRAKEQCEQCGEWVPLIGSVFEAAHLSHIIPRKRGGDLESNLEIKCYDCHIGIEHGPRWTKKEKRNDQTR